MLTLNCQRVFAPLISLALKVSPSGRAVGTRPREIALTPTPPLGCNRSINPFFVSSTLIEFYGQSRTPEN